MLCKLALPGASDASGVLRPRGREEKRKSAINLHCHSICNARPNAAPVHTKIAKDPDDGYTSGSLRQEQQASEDTEPAAACPLPAVHGGACKSFGVRAWHWQRRRAVRMHYYSANIVIL